MSRPACNTGAFTAPSGPCRRLSFGKGVSGPESEGVGKTDPQKHQKKDECEGIPLFSHHAEMMIKASEVLLEEKRRSYLISIARQGYTIKIGKSLFKEDGYSNRYINSTGVNPPVVDYLSNSKYSLMITSDGDGFSQYEDRMLYRWRPDIYANTGNYIYIKDMWSKRIGK